jgi:hypothetical protein
MNILPGTLAALAVMMLTVMSGYSSAAGILESGDSARLPSSRVAPERAGREPDGASQGKSERGGKDEPGKGGKGEPEGKREQGKEGERGEESGTKLALNEKYDHVRRGARLILVYDAPSNSFIGTVENTTGKTLKRVRVEVHLSNGKELGPTTPGDLKPGEKREVNLLATSKDFNWWTAHPEVGGGEHSKGGSK